MSITAGQVKELRERTGAGMMECKKFLSEANGDIELAIENMRKSGATKAAKKEGRITAEGIIATSVASDSKAAVILEINCETDFVARGDEFMEFAQQVADVALANKIADLADLNDAKLASGATVEETRQNLVAKIGENMTVRRLQLVETAGDIASYLHGGRIGVLVNVESGNQELNKSVAMHIAASNPVVVSPDDVPAELIEKEKEIYTAQAAESGKPADIIEKMVVGRVRKFLDEVSLHGQPFVMDPNSKVGDVLKTANANVLEFVRFEVGEGIEKQEANFAEEVMQQVKASE